MVPFLYGKITVFALDIESKYSWSERYFKSANIFFDFSGMAKHYILLHKAIKAGSIAASCFSHMISKIKYMFKYILRYKLYKKINIKIHINVWNR